MAAAGPVYTKHRRQRCGNNSGVALAIQFSLNTIEQLKNGLQTQSEAIPLFSMRKESLALSQSCCSVDDDAQCKQPLKPLKNNFVLKL